MHIETKLSVCTLQLQVAGRLVKSRRTRAQSLLAHCMSYYSSTGFAGVTDLHLFPSSILPPGTYFWIHAYSIHRDPRNFAHPDAFWPDRWLVASGRIPLAAASQPPTALSQPATAPLTHNESAFLPFSHGPMNCPGKPLALLELRMVVCAFLQRFRFRLAEGWDEREYEGGYKDHFVASRPELPVVLEAR